MDGQDYYSSFFASWDEKKKKKRPSFLDTLEEAQKYSLANPNYRENIAGVTKEAPYEDAPAQNWVSKDMAQAFKRAIELSDNPTEMEARLNTAYYLSMQKNIPFEDAFRDMDQILEHDYKVNMSPESGLAAVRDVFQTQMVNRMIYPLTYELKDKLLRGKLTSWSEVEADPLYQKIQEYEKMLPPEDARKRSFGASFLKSVVQVVPSFIEAAAVGALVGAAATATAGAALPALAAIAPGVFGMGEAMLMGGSLVATVPTIASLFGAVSGAAATTADMRVMEGGGAFYDMMKFRDPTTGARYNPMIAARMSTWYEGVSNAIELFQVGELLEPFSKILSNAQMRALQDSIRASISSVQDAASRAGGFLRAVNSTIGKFIVEWASGTLEESAEETIQEGVQSFFEEVAKTWTNRLDGTSIAPATRKEIQDRLVNTFVTSLEGMGVTELLPAGVRIFRETREAAREAVSDVLWEKIKDITTPGTPKEAPKPEVASTPQAKSTESDVQVQPLYFKSYEPEPGIIEIRGTTETTGTERKASIIVEAKVDDAQKIVAIDRIAMSKQLKDDPDEAIRQGVEAIKYLSTELDGYSFSFNPKGELARRVVKSLGEDFFKPKNVQTPQTVQTSETENRNPPRETPSETKTESNELFTTEAPQEAGKNEPAQSVTKPEVESTQNEPQQPGIPQQGESLAINQPQEGEGTGLDLFGAPMAPETTETEQNVPDKDKTIDTDMPKFEEEETGLSRLQSEGAARVGASLEGSYKYTTDDRFPVNKIEFSDELPQFKEGANKNGVVDPIRGEPEPMGMPPIVLYHTNDGHYYIVTGRHRLDLWRRNNFPTIPVHILHESDGYTMADMAVIDAEMNIRDNQGKEVDYVRYFSRTKYSYETAERRGLLRTNKAQSGFYIGTFASDSLKALFYSGKITGEKAAAIASAAPNDPELQAVGIKLAADRNNTPETIHNALALYAQTKRGESTQADLFGMNDDELLQTQLKISKAAEEIKGEIKAELNVLKQALRLGEKDRLRYIEKFGYKIGDRSQIASRIDELSDLMTKWETWAQDPKLFAQARARAEGKEATTVAESGAEYTPGISQYQDEQGWVYKSEALLRDKMKGPMPGRQILKMLQSAGVKQDELNWMGLEDYLNIDEKRSPQEVLDYIAGNKLALQEVVRANDNTKYGAYTLPGGYNYREILFRLPESEDRFISNHWVPDNILVHTRVDDRDPPGGKMLFVEEIQSDWHQEGRRRGYAETQWRIRDKNDPYKVIVTSKESRVSKAAAEAELERWKTAYKNEGNDPSGLEVYLEKGKGIPQAPFSKTWHEMVFRRLLRMAVEGGYQSIGWTTGEQQTDRYGLGDRVSIIQYWHREDVSEDGFYPEPDEIGYSIYGLNGHVIREQQFIKKTDLPGVFGEEIAKKILAKEGERNQDGSYVLSDSNLKIGGEGMKGFYDKILVDYANKYCKKWGVQVEPLTIYEESGEEYVVHGIKINDVMRASVMEGQYLFERSEEKYHLDVDKAQYRLQMVKARQIEQLLANNTGGFFNDEIEDFVIRTNQAIIKALTQAKSESVAFVTTARNDVKVTLTPALNDSGMWDVNLYVNGELASSERFKNRADAIVSIFTDTAPAFGGADTWMVSSEYVEAASKGSYTPSQQGDLFELCEKNDPPLEYDDKTIKLVYGSKRAFNAANQAIQSLFGDDESAIGDLFAQAGGEEGAGVAPGDREGVGGRRNPAVSSLLGREGDIAHPAYVENRKGQRRVSFVGQYVEGAADIARLFQVYRNSQVESTHFIYTNDKGEILAHNTISSGVPGHSIAVERAGKNWLDRREIILDRMERLGATQMYLLHNHPSGDTTPSIDDVAITHTYINYLGDKFAGQIVIDHDHAAVITEKDFESYFKNNGVTLPVRGVMLSSNDYDNIAKRVEFVKYEPAEGSYNIQETKGFKIDHTSKLVSIGADIIHGDIKNVLIVTDYRYRTITWTRINNPQPQAIYQKVKESGGVHAFIATNDPSFFKELLNSHKKASQAGGKYMVLFDAVLLDKNGNLSVDYFAPRELTSHYKYKMTNDKDKYLFELSREAEEFDSYDEFRNAYVHEGESEDDLKAAWGEAQKNKAGTPEEFIRRLSEDRTLFKNFLEANGADLFDKRVDRIHLGVVDAASYRLATGGVVPEATLDRALLLIKKNPEKWLARYNELAGMDTEYRDNFEIIGSSQSLDVLQARYHDALARLPDEQRQKVLNGATLQDADNIGALKLELEKKRKALEEYRSRLSYGEKQIIDMIRDSKKLDKEIWALRARAKLSEVNRARLREKEATKNELDRLIRDRIAALSPQAGLKNAAYLASKEAYQKARDEYRAEMALEKARRAERDLKLYYAKRITRPVAKNIDFKVAQQIIEKQKLIDPYFRRGGISDGPARSLDAWTLPELAQFYEEIEGMREYGRRLYEERQAVTNARRSEIRSAFLESIARAQSERKPYYYGTTEQREQEVKDRSIFKEFDLSLETIHRLARELDGRENGPFYQYLVEQERECYRREKFAYDKRVAAFEAKMRELGLDRDVMYREQVRLGDQTISKWEAIALYIGSKNPRTEKAFVFGNMMSQDERDNLSDEAFMQKAMENRENIKGAIAQLSEKEVQLADWLIQEGAENYERFAEAVYQIENRIPPKEDSYYPHERVMRSGETETEHDVALDALARAGKPARGVNKAPSKSRIDMSDRHQSPISLDAYQVYRRGWERQEHLISYTQFIADMNAILKRGPNAQYMREQIRLAYGQPVLDYLDRWIAEAANPKAFTDFNKTVRGFERVFKMMRGKLGIAYLGFRASRGVFQLITSPAPYLPYAGEYMVRRMIMNLNPAEYSKTLAFAKENSAFIRHRVINPVDAYIKEHIEKLPSKVQRSYYELAGAIMEFSDLWSVSTGWMAVYEKTAAALRKNPSLTADEIHAAAAKEADKVTIETQPTYRSQDLAPAFKMDSETWRFLLQFQTPLNVIYNQLFHDTRMDWKTGHKLRTIGIVTGYLSVAGLMALLTAPRHDDDEEDKRAKYFLSGVATTPLEAIPLVGSVAAGLVESAITGDRFWRDDQIFPGVAKLVQGVSRAMSADDEERAQAAFLQLLEGAGMLAGVPTSAVKEYYRALFKGDWGALIGKRP